MFNFKPHATTLRQQQAEIEVLKKQNTNLIRQAKSLIKESLSGEDFSMIGFSKRAVKFKPKGEVKMSKPNSIKIDDVTYVREDLASPKTSGEIRIVILQRGWVCVGRFTQEGSQCKLTNASTIRQWGTTKGLGEIALGGPTSKTILDKCPDVKFHELTVIATIDCVESKWNI